MASEDDGYVLDAVGNRILVGLTLVETREFERLDELILTVSTATTDANRSRNERRWLMLYDRHEAAVRIYLTTENAKALKASRTGRASWCCFLRHGWFILTYFIAFKMTREGTVLDANEMYCDEAEARERARSLATDTPVELWKGPRRIARFEPGRT
jgi:hypothetical protein